MVAMAENLEPLQGALRVYRPMRKAKCRFRIVYGGSGSAKSVSIAQDEIHRAWTNPRERTLVIRKVKATIRHSTYQLFRDILSGLNRLGEADINKSDMTITSPDGGAIIHAGLDDSEKLKSITGVTRIWIEEATELTREDLEQLDLRLRGAPDPQITLSFNPTKNATRIFNYVQFPIADLPTRNYAEAPEVFVQHTVYKDNPFVGEDYVGVFRRLGGNMQAVYERGELCVTDDPDQLISYEVVKRAFEMEAKEAEHDGKQRMGIDVARFGDDDTTIHVLEGYALVDTESFHGQDTNRTSSLAATKIRERGISPSMVGVDSIGIGAGVVDNLHAEGLRVKEFIAGASPIPYIKGMEKLKFNNLRSQAWWFTRELLHEGSMAICTKNPDHRRLIQEDLLAPRYRIGSEKTIEVEPKNGKTPNWGLKQRLSRSTDHGDSFVQGAFVDQTGGAPIKRKQMIGA